MDDKWSHQQLSSQAQFSRIIFTPGQSDYPLPWKVSGEDMFFNLNHSPHVKHQIHQTIIE